MDIVMKELFSTDIGLLSLFTITFIIGMAVLLGLKAVFPT